MRIRKSLLLLGGLLAIVALLGATTAFAQLSCTSTAISKSGSEVVPGNFTVSLQAGGPTTENGRTTYTYTINSPTGVNPNKLFIYVRAGLGTDLVAVDSNTPPMSGTYLIPHQTAGGFPPAEVWRAVHHQDGVAWTNIAINHSPYTLNVPEPYKPENGLTTILIGTASGYEHCGPILGPTTEAAPDFVGSPLVAMQSTMTLPDGCKYILTADKTTNIVKSAVADPTTPLSIDGNACVVHASLPGECEADTGLERCPEIELGRPWLVFTSAVADTPPTYCGPAPKAWRHVTSKTSHINACY